jgi:hypothetical protein
MTTMLPRPDVIEAEEPVSRPVRTFAFDPSAYLITNASPPRERLEPRERTYLDYWQAYDRPIVCAALTGVAGFLGIAAPYSGIMVIVPALAWLIAVIAAIVGLKALIAELRDDGGL